MALVLQAHSPAPSGGKWPSPLQWIKIPGIQPRETALGCSLLEEHLVLSFPCGWETSE